MITYKETSKTHKTNPQLKLIFSKIREKNTAKYSKTNPITDPYP